MPRWLQTREGGRPRGAAPRAPRATPQGGWPPPMPPGHLARGRSHARPTAQAPRGGAPAGGG
eukprot:7863062-Alexandrium_andersonii.AAC.1